LNLDWSFGMTSFATAWQWLRAALRERGAELRLCLRVTIAATLSLAVSHLLNLPLALWTVLTAVILTQMSVGRSLKATMDYFVATVGGAAYAGAVGALIPHDNEAALLAALALAVAPAALLAATNPRFSATPFTAVMVFLAPFITHTGPIASAIERVIEVAIGGVIGLAVSLVVFPARAHDLAIEGAANLLNLIRRLLPELFAGFSHGLDDQTLRHMQASIGAAIVQLDAVAAEARHERMTRLAAEPDQGPLLRTLLRLRHDLVMIGRAAAEPLPAPFRTRTLARAHRRNRGRLSAQERRRVVGAPPAAAARRLRSRARRFRRRNGLAAPRGLDANTDLGMGGAHLRTRLCARSAGAELQRSRPLCGRVRPDGRRTSDRCRSFETVTAIRTYPVENGMAASGPLRFPAPLSADEGLKAPGRRRVELGPIELFLEPVKNLVADLSLRAQPMQRLPLSLDRSQPELIVLGRRLRRALVAGRRARGVVLVAQRRRCR
jgi:hypothetical protein